MADARPRLNAAAFVLAAIPLALLVGLVWWLFAGGAARLFDTGLPPVDRCSSTTS